MKKTIISCVTALLFLVTTAALAGDYGYRHHGYRHHGFSHYGHRGGGAGYFVGGLLLGTLLAPPRYVPPPTVVYVPQPINAAPRVSYAPPPQAPVGRRLLRDINGNCFERKVDARGNELRTQLPASECVW